MGGLLAMQYAIAHQDHLLGLVLLNTAPADSNGQKAFLDEFVEPKIFRMISNRYSHMKISKC